MTAAPVHPVFGRLSHWIGEAGSQFGWRQILIACVLVGVNALIGPAGGLLFAFSPAGGPRDPIVLFLSGEYVLRFMPIIFLTMVADAAYRDGVPAKRAYFLAWLFGSTLGPFLTYYVKLALGIEENYNRPFGLLLQLATQGGLILWMYADWRTTQTTRRAFQAAERERAEDERRLQRTRLKELQVRIDPQLLFDTLTDVAELHEADPTRSRAVFDDLIIYLRTLLPKQSSESPTVHEEMTLADAWWRVRLRRMVDAPVLAHALPSALASEPIAPMVVIALIQVAASLAQPSDEGWSVDYSVKAERLRLVLHAPERIDWVRSIELDVLRQRLRDAYADQAVLTSLPRPVRIELDLPRIAGGARP